MAAAIESRSSEGTAGIGRALARLLLPGDVVLLHGDLGAGKTTLVQGIAEGLGVADRPQSPTFTLVAEYEGRLASGEPVRLYHLDLYRLEHADELDSIGYGDLLDAAEAITLIEWPERAGDRLPDDYLLISMAIAGPDTRRIQLEGEGQSQRLAAQLGEMFANGWRCG